VNGVDGNENSGEEEELNVKCEKEASVLGGSGVAMTVKAMYE